MTIDQTLSDALEFTYAQWSELGLHCDIDEVCQLFFDQANDYFNDLKRTTPNLPNPTTEDYQKYYLKRAQGISKLMQELHPTGLHFSLMHDHSEYWIEQTNPGRGYGN